MKRSKLRTISKKRQKDLKIYAKLREDFLLANPMCQVCGIVLSSGVHHKRGRGRYLNVVEYFCATCFSCHNYIENNREWAREKGYLLDRIGHD